MKGKPEHFVRREVNYVVMRYPVLMEDEGRHSFMRRFDTRLGAENWIARQKDQYFGPSDYYIAVSG